MEIKFSRHAKRRRILYGIPEDTVKRILENKELINGKQEVIEECKDFKYPLKVVVSVENDLAVVITCYPLKRGGKK